MALNQSPSTADRPMTYREALAVMLVLIICGAPLLAAGLAACGALRCGGEAPTIVLALAAILSQGWVLARWRNSRRQLVMIVLAALVIDCLLLLGRFVGWIPP